MDSSGNTEARGENRLLDTQLSLLNTANYVMEFLLTRAGTMDVKAGVQGGYYVIRVRGTSFKAITEGEVAEKFLRWLLDQPEKWSKEQINEAAGKASAIEHAQALDLLETLGRNYKPSKEVAEKYKGSRERYELLFKALQANTLATMQELRNTTGLEDITLEEINAVMEDLN